MDQHGEDVLATGETPRVTDSVAGDVILAGQDLSFSGATGGDYLGAGGKQIISGRIHGSVRAAGGDIRISSTVDRNATIAGGRVTIDSLGVIGRSAYLVGGTVEVDGAINDALQVGGGTVILNGRIGQNVEVHAGTLRIGPNAEIGGNLRYRVPQEAVHIDPSARILGTVTALPVPQGRGGWFIFKILWTIGFLIAGAVVASLIPRFVMAAATLVRTRPVRSGLMGMVWIIVVPIVVAILAVTVIGLPLALLTAAIYAALLYLGRGVIAVWLGQRILGARMSMGTERRNAVMSFLVGGLILVILGFIPFIGSFLIAIATVLGVGAILQQIRMLRSSETFWNSSGV